MKIILNGMGCPYSGARLVLVELLKTIPESLEVLAIVPKVSKDDNYEFVGKKIKLIKLNVKYWSLYFRPFLEIWVNILKIVFNYNAVFNISNYGLCLTKNQVLYIHNQYIVDMQARTKLGGGYPNAINRFGLNTFLKNAEAVFVQSNHIFETLKKYCTQNKIKFPEKVNVLTPLPMISAKVDYKELEKKFAFQFFYPASDFEHKRVELAAESIIKANKIYSDIGLCVTASDNKVNNGSVVYLSQIPHESVLNNINSCDALIFTSEREALGLPLLESLYFNKPAVLPDLEYAREIYGDAGVYFKSFHSNDVVNAIEELRNNFNKYSELTLKRKNEIWPKLRAWGQHWTEFINQIENKD